MEVTVTKTRVLTAVYVASLLDSHHSVRAASPKKTPQTAAAAISLDQNVDSSGPDTVMSSAQAAGPETVALPEASSSPQQAVPQPDSPSKQDPRDSDASASLDGRSNDADKMLQSSMVLDAEGDGGGAVDASGQRPAEAAAGDEPQQWSEEENHELKRVKVYELIGARWVDQGTAFCFGDVHENEAFLIARAEADLNQIILTTTIRSSDVYQRQQGRSSSV